MRNPIIGALLVALCPVASVAGDGVVALQTAAASCRTTTTPPPIYVDCLNGTVTDNRSGLVWLQDADCVADMTWHKLMQFVAGMADGDCGLTNGSSPGDWRLPTLAELEAMVADAAGGGGLACTPAITNDQGSGCWDSDCFEAGFCSFFDIQAIYPSATSSTAVPTFVWYMAMAAGTGPLLGGKASSAPVWPVRGGQ